MATFALKDCTAWIHGYDFTGDSNEIALNADVEGLDATVFGATYRARQGGLRSVEAELSGLWQSATSAAVDPEVFPDLGTADRVCTVSPTGSTETSVAYMFQAGKFGMEMLGKVGDLAPFNLSLMGTNGVGMVRGQVAKARGNVSATGAIGSGVNLGAVGASQYLYGTFHVFGTPGTTITLVLESDDANTFASATTRATIGPVTTAGGTWATRVAGSITDTWFRYRVTAVTGTFNVAGAIGIG